MMEERNLLSKERTVKHIRSVVQRNYPNRKEREKRLIVRRKQDMLICILEGESFYEFEGHSLELRAGDVLFMARECCYERRIRTKNYRTVYCYFDLDEETENLPPYQLFRGVEGIEMGFMRLYKKWAGHGQAYKSESMGLLYQIFAQLIKAQKHDYLSHDKRVLFDEVLHLLSEQYTDPALSVAELARKSGLSEVHFRRLFHKVYNTSPQDYITNLRVQYAKEQLQYSSGSLEEIAGSVGFADPGYFSRIFRRKTGFTPTEFRKQIEGRSELMEKKYSQEKKREEQ